MKNFRLTFLLTAFILLPLFSFCQERVTEHIGDGSNTIFYNTEHDGKLYLIRVTQCDEIEVLEIKDKDQFVKLHSLLVPDVFGAIGRTVITNEYLCFPSYEGISVYNFIQNSVDVTPLPAPWQASNFISTSDYKLNLRLRLADQSDGINCVFDIFAKEIILLDSLSLFKFQGDYFIERQTGNGIYSYFLYEYETGTRDTLVTNVTMFRGMEWLDSNRLIYINKDGILETYNVEEDETISYNSVITDTSEVHSITLGGDKFLISSDGFATAYDLDSKDVIGSKLFEDSPPFMVRTFEFHNNVVVAYEGVIGSVAAYFWNLSTDQVEYFDYSVISEYKVHQLTENESLIRTSADAPWHFSLAIVNHDDLSINPLKGEMNFKLDNVSTLYEKDGLFYLNIEYDRYTGFNSLIEIDTALCTAKPSSILNDTNNGFPNSANLKKLNAANIVFSDSSNEFYDLLDKGVIPIDTSKIEWFSFKNGRVYYYNEETKVLKSYDGEIEEVIDFYDYSLLSDINFYPEEFVDYENLILINDRGLFAINKTDGTSFEIDNLRLENDLTRYNEWTYFTNENGLFRIDSLLNQEHVSPLEVNMDRYSFIYQDKVHVTYDESFYELTEQGELKTISENEYRFYDNPIIPSPDSKHLVFSTREGVVHYDGETFSLLSTDFTNPRLINENIIKSRDQIYFLDEKSYSTLPLELQNRPFYYFSVYGKDYVSSYNNFVPYSKVGLYRVSPDFSDAELITELMQPIDSRGCNAVEFEENSLVLMSGTVSIFSKDEELVQVTGLIVNKYDLIVEGEDVYFLAYEKKTGNQVYRWNPNFESGIVEQVSTAEPISIYPNPSSGSFHIHDTKVRHITRLQVYDTAGNSVPSQFRGETCELLNKVTGLYFVTIVFADKSSMTGKLVIE